jgi:hypothetical protein
MGCGHGPFGARGRHPSRGCRGRLLYRRLSETAGTCPGYPSCLLGGRPCPLLHSGQYGVVNRVPCLPVPGMSRHQNSGSPVAAGARRLRRGGGDGLSAWSAAWTAAATSCAVSASMTIFRRSSTRRTTCPACGSASCGPMVEGSVTLGTVKETVLVELLDTPGLQRLLGQPPGGVGRIGRPQMIMPQIVRFPTSSRRTPHRVRRAAPDITKI